MIPHTFLIWSEREVCLQFEKKKKKKKKEYVNREAYPHTYSSAQPENDIKDQSRGRQNPYYAYGTRRPSLMRVKRGLETHWKLSQIRTVQPKRKRNKGKKGKGKRKEKKRNGGKPTLRVVRSEGGQTVRWCRYEDFSLPTYIHPSCSFSFLRRRSRIKENTNTYIVLTTQAVILFQKSKRPTHLTDALRQKRWIFWWWLVPAVWTRLISLLYDVFRRVLNRWFRTSSIV